MAKFRYIGDREHGNCLGLMFPRSVYVDVDSGRVATKLRGNPAFQELVEAAPAPAAAPTPPRARRSAAPAPSPDGAGDKDGNTSDDNGGAGDGDERAGKNPGAD